MDDLLWQLDGVEVAGRPAPRLTGVSLRIRRGVTAVIGFSGAGKTTLLNLLVGFEKPNGGLVRPFIPTLDGRPALFWVPPTHGLWPHCTVRQHVELVMPAREGGDGEIGRARLLPSRDRPARREPRPPADPEAAPARRDPRPPDADQALALLAEFDLTDRAHAYPDELSQGERSRLAVARALATQARVHVMDEPLVHVDPARTDRYWGVIRRHLGATGASLVFATHAPETVLAHAQRVICLRDGKVQYEGPVDDLYWRPATPQLAECLGPCNWFDAPEARLWLGQVIDQPRGYRPEQVEIVPACSPSHLPAGDKPTVPDQTATCAGVPAPSASGAWSPHPVACGDHPLPQGERVGSEPLLVCHASFQGSVAVADLRHPATQALRRFYHRPSGDWLKPGGRVVIRLIGQALLLACLLPSLVLPGCGGDSEPAIPVREVHYIAMPPAGAKVPAPRSMAAGPGNQMYVLDRAARVLVYDALGQLVRQWSMPETQAGNPEGVVVMKDGHVAVTDTHYSRVVIFTQEGQVVRMFGSRGSEPGQFDYPVGITQDDRGALYVCEYGENCRVQKFTPQGQVLLCFGRPGTGPGEFQRPAGLTWHAGKLYVADAINNRIEVYHDDGRYVGTLGAGGQPPQLKFPYDLAIAGDGALYVVEYGAGRVTKLDLAGRVRGRWGATGRGEGQLVTPWGLAVDASGRLWIADTGNRRIVELKL